LSETNGNLNYRYKETTTTDTNMKKTFDFRFIDEPSRVVVELTNASEKTLKSIEILTVFLKDEDTPGGGPSQAHIRFEGVKSMQPGEKTVLSHRTWINGKPVDADHDQMQRLKLIAGQANPYALDISWEEPDGKMRFQRIPVGN
jgi:hypothetical protein